VTTCALGVASAQKALTKCIVIITAVVNVLFQGGMAALWNLTDEANTFSCIVLPDPLTVFLYFEEVAPSENFLANPTIACHRVA
jgi:hypothetical protein